MWPLFQLSPVCDTFRHILCINRNLNVGLFDDSAEDLDGSPKLGSWDRLSSWHLAPQETDALQLERGATEDLHGESGHSECDLSQIFGSVTVASRSVRGYQQIVVGTLIETTAFPLATNREQTTLDQCSKIPAPMLQGDRIPSCVCDWSGCCWHIPTSRASWWPRPPWSQRTMKNWLGKEPSADKWSLLMATQTRKPNARAAMKFLW